MSFPRGIRYHIIIIIIIIYNGCSDHTRAVCRKVDPGK